MCKWMEAWRQTVAELGGHLSAPESNRGIVQWSKKVAWEYKIVMTKAAAWCEIPHSLSTVEAKVPEGTTYLVNLQRDPAPSGGSPCQAPFLGSHKEPVDTRCWAWMQILGGSRWRERLGGEGRIRLNPTRLNQIPLTYSILMQIYGT